ncbi:Spy/CpxP family protein refolding chaperone [Occallatibacter riparius]|uniref:Spy/CpxP family protein refolding chaperone n=1 Tax=Occallatibacter riparius TaxID=1002689 RepID=A0A9J7BH41_9BACT|nr:Spy/CpxP family protein refolding chaperone [Occallatibacter riparius]UWZ82055.1 Spy/CpxP family protein refolding chaperone [Occallatibacter riparius]
MKAHNLIQTALLIAALAAGGLQAVAQAPDAAPGSGFGEHRPPMERALGAHGPHGRWWNDPQVIEKLNLTDDQRKSMDDILQQNRDGLIDKRAGVEKAEGALEPLISADQPNESAILAQIDKVAQARAELEKANARFLLALRAKLSPDQWKQLQAIRSERHRGPGPAGTRGWRRGGPGPGGPGAGPAGSPPPPGGPEPQSFLNELPAPGQPAITDAF